MMRRKIVKLPAPSEAAAASISRSISSSSGCTARTTKGRVTKQRATTTAARVKARSIPSGLSAPYSVSSVRLATIVGSAKGRSITALIKPLPGNASRTRIQARIVPKKPLMTTTISEQIKTRLPSPVPNQR